MDLICILKSQIIYFLQSFLQVNSITLLLDGKYVASGSEDLQLNLESQKHEELVSFFNYQIR